MDLSTDANPILKSSGKGSVELEEHLTHSNMSLPFKRRAAYSNRSFPEFCGPNAPGGRRGLEDSSEVHNTASPATSFDGVAIAAVPLSIVPPASVHSEANLKHRSAVESSRETIGLKVYGNIQWEASSSRSNYVSNDKEHEDCMIIEEKINDKYRGSGLTERIGWPPISRKTPRELDLCESPLESKLDGEADEAEVLILSPWEWESTLSGRIRQEGSKNQLAAKPAECSRTESVEFGSHEEVEQGQDVDDLSIVRDNSNGSCASRQQVLAARKLFEEVCTKTLEEYYAELRGGRDISHVYNKTATLLKNQQKWVNVEPKMGHVPGIEIGDKFGYRAELAIVGLHHQYIRGIDWMTIDGEKYAISIVDSGRYENKIISTDSFVYSGHGGNEKLQKTKADQKLEAGNLALKNSMDKNYPVRVIRKHLVGATGKKSYIYEGLYIVQNFWQDRVQNDKLAFMFDMVRLSGQPDCSHHGIHHVIEEPKLTTRYLVDDLSNGKEKIPICVVNKINNEKPPLFTYITEMRYPDWHHISSLSGCDCINGCSDFELCCCGARNGVELPFNEKGCIIKRRTLVHECGPCCKCPPSCQNRVSQHGPRYQLEVFRTKSTGWGVRSQEEIPIGGFICEYIGQLLQDKEAEERIDDDEYLFDLDKNDGFTIDASKFGNVGRFINHSCSPNVFAQKVLYDNEDERLPHIMFFATKDIPPWQELTYDYNYKIGQVCDAYGNTKIKICRCGSRKCIGRMY